VKEDATSYIIYWARICSVYFLQIHLQWKSYFYWNKEVRGVMDV
jgi:hypothetical protein